MRANAAPGSRSSSSSVTDGLRELAICGSGVVTPEDGASGDEQIGARVPRGSDRLAVDAAVDLDTHAPWKRGPQLREPFERLGLERLPRIAGVDGHAQHEIGAVRRC